MAGYRLVVRTLDFHSSNVGSTPSGLNILEKALTTKQNMSKLQTREAFQYKVYFVSSIPAHNLESNTLYSYDAWSKNNQLPSKFSIKKSYLIMSWFHQFCFSSLNSNNKKSIHFATLPTTRSRYTLTKAPMAHKTNSKEQYEFRFYYTVATLNFRLKPGNFVNSVNAAALSIILCKKSLPLIATSILLIKHYTIMYYFNDLKFYNYSHFLKIHTH